MDEHGCGLYQCSEIPTVQQAVRPWIKKKKKRMAARQRVKSDVKMTQELFFVFEKLAADRLGPRLVYRRTSAR